MRSYVFITIISVVGLSTGPLGVATAHEAHKMECNETAMNAMKADIQSMPEGKAKAEATKEMDTAEAMFGMKDMKACEDHMHNAMKTMEE
ncbi:hypothetical protein [Methyloceanibacter sp.]|uniref:hypothetical protein n=1 Tax=Methyloceanibacter sp. TaxID=1965321 RepID=UPI002C96332E|nr:hypothetical protein [Methyloceanibacter sp.]HML93006.1 hypothetical protein [Methyloceanibacter sp.]